MILFNYRVVFLIVLFSSLLFSVALHAAPYRPSQPVLLETELQSTESASTQHQTKHYRVELDAPTPNVQLLNFYTATSEGNLLCRFTFQDDGTTTWQKTDKGLPQPIRQALFLSPGFPLPVDILPVASQVEQTKNYEIQTTSGGRIFKNSYTVEISEVLLDSAMENGWIKKEVPLDTKFLLFSVTTTQQKIISKQLWPVGGEWWLYEETPFRKSWRIDS